MKTNGIQTMGNDLLIHVLSDVAGRLVEGNVLKLKSGLAALKMTLGLTVMGNLLSEEDTSASMVNSIFNQRPM
jgi:hypothetical protein